MQHFKLKKIGGLKQNDQLQASLDLPDKLSSGNKSSLYKSFSHNQKLLIKCSSGVIQSIKSQSSQRTQSFRIDQKRNIKGQQCFFETEIQMIEHQKKDNENIQNELISIFRSKSKQSFFNKRYNLLSYQFANKIKRNNPFSYKQQIEKQLQLLNNGKFASINSLESTLFARLTVQAWKIFSVTFFILCALSLPFINIISKQCFIIFQVSIIFLLASMVYLSFRQILSNSSKCTHNFIFQKYLSQKNCLYVIGIVISIVNIFLWFFSSESFLIAYLNSYFFVFCFEIIDTFHNFVIKIIFSKKMYILFPYIYVVKIVIKILIFGHILSCVLSKLVISNAQNNWLSVRLETGSEITIFLISMNEAVTILLSAGFYMPLAVNQLQSLCFIVIRLIVLIISLTNTGILIQYFSNFISKNQNNTISKLQALKNICQNHSIDKAGYSSLIHIIQNQLKHKNKQQQYSLVKNLINKLPNTQKRKANQQILRPLLQIYRSILPCLSKKVLLALAQYITYQTYHSNQVCQDFTRTYDFFILSSGTIAGASKSKNNPIFTITNQNHYKLLNCNFLTRKFPNYQIKCLTSSTIGRIRQNDFRNCIKIHTFDHQYLWMKHDKFSLFTDAFETTKCQYCSCNHTLFDCPYFHYIPFSSLIVSRYLSKKGVRTQKLRRDFLSLRINRIKSSSLKYYSKTFKLLNQVEADSAMELGGYKQLINAYQIPFHQTMIQIINIEQLYESESTIRNISQKLKQMQTYCDNIWLLESDKLWNFKYYFIHFNPDNISNIRRGKYSNNR